MDSLPRKILRGEIGRRLPLGDAAFASDMRTHLRQVKRVIQGSVEPAAKIVHLLNCEHPGIVCNNARQSFAMRTSRPVKQGRKRLDNGFPLGIHQRIGCIATVKIRLLDSPAQASIIGIGRFALQLN